MTTIYNRNPNRRDRKEFMTSRRRSKSKTLTNIQCSTMLPELPKDLVEEILCRVPATSLNRLRTICKAWNRLIKDDRRFASKHSDKAAKELIPLMLTKDYSVFAFSVVNIHGTEPSVVLEREFKLLHRRSEYQFDISRVFHCDGLLLCNPVNESRIVVWNPFTRETRWIEAGLKRGFTFVLGYSQDYKSSCKSYKILSFYSGIDDSEIYDFNSDSWRVLDYDIAVGCNPVCSSHYVSLKGNIYWFARDETGTKSLLRFDFSTEKSELVPLPFQCDTSFATILSVVREEKLSVLLQRRHKGSKTEIWVTNKIHETKVMLWSKVLALDLDRDLQITAFGSFLLDEEKKVVQICQRWFDVEDDDGSNNSDMLYVVEEDKEVATIIVSEVDEITVCWPAILNYVPSLVQIKRAGGKRKRGELYA